MEENVICKVYSERNCCSCPPAFAFKPWEYADSGNPSLLFLLSPGPHMARSIRFISQHLERNGISDWLVTGSVLCNEKCQNECRFNISKLLFLSSPKLVVPCGREANSLFGLYVGQGGLFFFQGEESTSLVMPLFDPHDLMRDTGENEANYICFINALNDIRFLMYMLQEKTPSKEFLDDNGIEFSFLSVNKMS